MIDRRMAGGAVLGVVLTVGTIAGASAFRSNSADVPSDVMSSRTLLTGPDAMAMGCAPHEAAVTEHLMLRGQRVLNSRCVVVSGLPISQQGVPYPGMASGWVPAAYSPQPAVLTGQPTLAPAPRVRQGEAAIRSSRTWKKSALVIGGSTAAGAGIGGAIGGKKGALIGAAIGGGGSTLFEAMKRR